MQFFWGTFICHLQHYPPALAVLTKHPRASRLLALLFLVMGLTIASYPEQHPEWQPWSAALHNFLEPILPRNPDFPRFSSGFGLELVVVSLYFSPTLRDILSSRALLWLGKQSFAVYLLHGSMLRIVLCWMLYGAHLPPDTVNEKGEKVRGQLRYPGNWYLLACLPFWLPMVYAVAVLWTRYVDPVCARLTQSLVGRIELDRDEKRMLLK
jgi:peptidoglycan/LPS O-acetylase OafA/YrhL